LHLAFIHLPPSRHLLFFLAFSSHAQLPSSLFMAHGSSTSHGRQAPSTPASSSPPHGCSRAPSSSSPAHTLQAWRQLLLPLFLAAGAGAPWEHADAPALTLAATFSALCSMAAGNLPMASSFSVAPLWRAQRARHPSLCTAPFLPSAPAMVRHILRSELEQ
jgi:hypothetical protein